MQCSRLLWKTNVGGLQFSLPFTRQLCSINNSLLCPKFPSVLIVGRRTLIYEPDKKGIDFPYKHKPKLKDAFDKEYYAKGFQELKKEIKLWTEEVKEHFRNDPIMEYRHNEVDVWWRFRSEEDFDKWICTSDSDLNVGRSTASLTKSPQGYALFSGKLCTDVPQDGKIKRTGFANLGSIRARKSFKRESTWDWSHYTHLVIKARGDGRSYMLNVHIHAYTDVCWFDVFHFILFTRGGPYWQTSKIPLSKFFLGSKGRIQDTQFAPPLERVKSLSFTTGEGNVGGPFSLEIAYIGLVHDSTHKEETAYEMYKVPLFMTSH